MLQGLPQSALRWLLPVPLETNLQQDKPGIETPISLSIPNPSIPALHKGVSGKGSKPKGQVQTPEAPPPPPK